MSLLWPRKLTKEAPSISLISFSIALSKSLTCTMHGERNLPRSWRSRGEWCRQWSATLQTERAFWVMFSHNGSKKPKKVGQKEQYPNGKNHERRCKVVSIQRWMEWGCRIKTRKIRDKWRKLATKLQVWSYHWSQVVELDQKIKMMNDLIDIGKAEIYIQLYTIFLY